MPKIPDNSTESDVIDSAADNLKPYLFHGLDLNQKKGDKEALGDCPFCGKSGKFSVDTKTSKFKCWSCNESGNSTIFLRKLHEESQSETQPSDLSELAKERGFISFETLLYWGVVKSLITDEWLIPGYGVKGEINNLYRYGTVGGKKRLLSTPTLHHQIHGMDQYHSDKETVYICEGPWDGIALWEVMFKTEVSDEGLEETANTELNLLKDSNVIAIPGCNVFKEQWAGMFEDKIVNIMFDNDHPRTNPKTGKEIVPAGYAGMKRLAGLLSGSKTPPRQINFLRWGDDPACASEEGTEGIDLSLPDGCDLRDYLTDSINRKKGSTVPASLGVRRQRLGEIFDRIHPVPDKLLLEPATASGKCVKVGNLEEEGGLECLPCTDYKSLINSWKKAMKWTEGLECALSVMLASVTSTMSVGDQLWLKILGPPACLHKDTLIYDPIAKTTLTVAERKNLGEKFSVFTKLQDGTIGVAEALIPEESKQPETLYKVSFKSGREIIVTGGHKFWNGQTYVPLLFVLQQLDAYSSYPLPSISESDLLAHVLDVQRWKKTPQDFQSDYCAYSCHDDEQPQYGGDNDLASLPSQVDVQEYSHLKSDEDDFPGISRKCTHPQLQPFPLSNLDYQPLSLPLQGVFLALPQIVSGNDVMCFRWFSSFCCNVKLSDLLHRVQSLVGFVLKSIDTQTQFLLQQVSWKREPDLLSASQQSHTEFFPVDRVQHTFSSSQMTKPCCEEFLGDVSQLFQVLDNAEQQLDPLSLSDSTQPLSFLPDTERQAVDDVLLTNPQQVPLIFSIKEHTRLDGLFLTQTDEIVKVEYYGEETYYDFHVPLTNNYWAEGVFHHNSGKSTLCEALSINKRFILAKSTIRGFHSGWKGDPGEDGEEKDTSLASKAKGKTLVIKDGDTLLQAPNLGQILSEARDIYDRTSRTDYRNTVSRNYEGLSMTWILCGTAALRLIDSSELGARFLDCTIMEGIDSEFEDDVLYRVAHRTERNLAIETDADPTTQQDPDMTEAMQLTGGYVTHLRENAQDLLGQVVLTDKGIHTCIYLGKFVAFMRARPALDLKRLEDTATREFATRLVSQLVRLAKCMAVVMNRKVVDAEVLKRTRKVALDTARGITLQIAKRLYDHPEGLDSRSIAVLTVQPEETTRKMMRFLYQIQFVEPFTTSKHGMKSKPRWRLRPEIRELLSNVLEDSTEEEKGI